MTGARYAVLLGDGSLTRATTRADAEVQAARWGPNGTLVKLVPVDETPRGTFDHLTRTVTLVAWNEWWDANGLRLTSVKTNIGGSPATVYRDSGGRVVASVIHATIGQGETYHIHREAT